MRTCLFLLAIAVASPVLACAPAPRAGERIDVVEETAIIVWDPATRTEHFIRRATFRGEGRDFGFLVPTPAKPELAEFDDSVFARLEEKTTRRTIHTTRKAIDWSPLFAFHDKGEGAIGAAPPVTVLSTQKIAGYEAAILDATDATELRMWLDGNGYATTPDLVEWLDAYVQKRWKITAFKVEKPAQTSAVRMTFTTDQPFFPYREPASQRENSDLGRRLRVFFLGPQRVEGKIGGINAWPHDLTWSERLKFDVGIPVPPNTRLTRFEDESTPRPGTDDLYFAPSADQSEMIPEPLVIETVDKTRVPIDLVIAPVVFLVLFLLRRLRRR